MGQILNLFPVRAAIGQADASGQVFMSREFAAAMAQLLERVGGPSGAGIDDLGADLAHATLHALGQSLAQSAHDLQQQMADLMRHVAVLGELRKALDDVELAGLPISAPTDWEHPGKIGASTANSGKFTTLTATDKVQLNPVAKDVEIKPTGAQLLTIQPAQAGQIDNMELGKTAPRPARVSTLNLVTLTQPATGATITLSDGVTLTVPASVSTGNLAARSATSLGAAATDAASTQTLVNTIRSVLLSVGIGS